MCLQDNLTDHLLCGGLIICLIFSCFQGKVYAQVFIILSIVSMFSSSVPVFHSNWVVMESRAGLKVSSSAQHVLYMGYTKSLHRNLRTLFALVVTFGNAN